MQISGTGPFPETIKSLFAEHFEFLAQVDRLEKAYLLLLVLQRFASVDLTPAKVPNEERGLVFEELIRRFAEQSIALHAAAIGE